MLESANGFFSVVFKPNILHFLYFIWVASRAANSLRSKYLLQSHGSVALKAEYDLELSSMVIQL